MLAQIDYTYLNTLEKPHHKGTGSIFKMIRSFTWQITLTS
ncbi:hypothetical protein SAMN05216522_10463 [Rosenbergiella nectarea]|uniref:Uncharacterized protein n=1 Tax=Rosenbergiella nectarea TaxID=988801 RepID=A0A1H9H3R5_9GAMM|nr:hypothetical protein SAMN05216522_10463 [Rosenbergiella nectarea]